MKNKSALGILTALVVSVVAGIALQGNVDIANGFQPLGKIYINLVKMIMVPLVFSSLLLGISNITDMKKIGKMGGMTVGVFLVTTALAVIIGLISVSNTHLTQPTILRV